MTAFSTGLVKVRRAVRWFTTIRPIRLPGWVAAALLSLLCACGPVPPSAPTASDGRYLARISIDPEARHLLLTDCESSAPIFNGCDLLSLDLMNGRLSRYVLGKERLLEGSYSSHGDEIMVVVSAGARGSPSSEAGEESRIGMMHPDGSGWRLLNIPLGGISGPVLSPDRKRVAYWRGVARPPGSKTFAADHDVYEYDMTSGRETLFAGPFEFFEKTGIIYLSPDRLLLGAYGPRQFADDMTKYDQTNSRSAVYVVERGATTLPRPVLRDVTGAEFPTKDAADNTYFVGERPGIAFFRRSPGGAVTQWSALAASVGNGIRDVAVASNGKAVAYLFDPASDPFHVDRSKSPQVGMLDTGTGAWRTVEVPPTATASKITVR
ncbi:hypothetical protein [Sphingobium sp. BS19]|uniref:hypothetical protein n=1 Tax=Sphingobium sp. BS19 TaxID=3018973 RepID=UPI00249045A7|nr:hypothetical protein [Sphingobium sp. BS19]